MLRILLLLALFPVWGAAQPSLPDVSPEQLALEAFQTGFGDLSDSIRAGKLFQRWRHHWQGRLDQNHTANTLLETYLNPQPNNSQLFWTYAGPGAVDTQRQGPMEHTYSK